MSEARTEVIRMFDRAGVSIQAFAERAGVDRTTMSAVLNRRKQPGMPLLKRLGMAAMLKVPNGARKAT